MNRTGLIRLGGLGIMAGALLFVAGPLSGRYLLEDMEVFLVVALALMPVGMVGFHALQGRNYGLVGRVGFWMTVVAPLAVALGSASYLWWGRVFGASLLWLAFPVGPLVLLAGFVLYGAATLRAGVLPRWCGVLFIVALAVALASGTVMPMAFVFVVFGPAWLALGYALWSHRDVASARASRVL